MITLWLRGWRLHRFGCWSCFGGGRLGGLVGDGDVPRPLVLQPPDLLGGSSAFLALLGPVDVADGSEELVEVLEQLVGLALAPLGVVRH